MGRGQETIVDQLKGEKDKNLGFAKRMERHKDRISRRKRSTNSNNEIK